MAATLLTFKDLCKKREGLTYESGFDKLYYLFCSPIFIGISLYIESVHVFKEPLQCGDDRLNSHCLRTAQNLVYEDSPLFHEAGYIGSENLIYWKYYPFTSIYFFAQGLSLIVPHILWKLTFKMYELKDSLNGLNDITHINNDEEAKKLDYQTEIAAENFLKISKSKRFSLLYCMRLFLKALTLNICILQYYLVDSLFNNQFLAFGFNVINVIFYEGLQKNTHSIYFPTSCKCIWYDVGPSGTWQNVDTICTMPLNVFHPHAYFLLWALLLTMLLCSTIQLLTIILTGLPYVGFLIRGAVLFSCRMDWKIAKILGCKLNLDSYILLQLIQRNTQPSNFNLFVEILVEKIRRLND